MAPSAAEEETQAAERLRRRLRRKLPGFSAEGAAVIDIWQMRTSGGDPLEELPVQPLVLFMLHYILG